MVQRLKQKFPMMNLIEKGRRLPKRLLNVYEQWKVLKMYRSPLLYLSKQSKTSIVPGNFFAYANAEKEVLILGIGRAIDEKYVLFPSSDATEQHRDDANFIFKL